MNCPFCNEQDFDLIGLKYHLLCHCEVWEKTQDLKELPSVKADPTIIEYDGSISK